ncbi:MAG: hypothetical protein Q4D38_01455 [Planctomycetia bacterium]|nr:hypothetical protein [Planctomycetia bacterium]
MKLQELLEKYEFHDSGLEGVLYHSETQHAEVEIEFCNWKQDYFKKGMPEQPIIRLVFTGVSEMEHAGLDQYDEGNTILDASLVQNHSVQEGIEFLVYNVQTNEAKHLRIFAEDVEFVMVDSTS